LGRLRSAISGKLFCHGHQSFPKEQAMDNPIQNKLGIEELHYEQSFGSIEGPETIEETTSMKDPDTTLSMIVLLLACLALAALAHVIV
jgi:hypothetical protein